MPSSSTIELAQPKATPPRTMPLAYATSSLTQQLEHNEGERTPTSSFTARLHSPKPRSLSDAPKPTLSPSPAFREPSRRISKDDISISSPSTPKRPAYLARGLSLQMPQKESLISPSGPASGRVPLSPKLDSSQIYGSPSSMLPRRSRGLDYTRACTNLHHSTLAESSPDASPTIGGRGISIPNRRSLGSTVLDSPSNMSTSLWSTMPSGERTALSSSVSSINMMDTDSDSDDYSEDMSVDRESEDPMLNTPAASKLNGNFMANIIGSPGSDWMSSQTSPAVAGLMSFRQRMKVRKDKSRYSSSSLSRASSRSKPSPGNVSPPIMKSIETSNGGYFSPGLTRKQIQSRRESLSLGTDDLHLSDSDDLDPKADVANAANMENNGIEGQRGVVRRAVTRRGNLLPKTKNFARIRAALFEEAAPIDSEARREAEVIRQVQENDPAAKSLMSPELQPTLLTAEPFDTTSDTDMMGLDPALYAQNPRLSRTFGQLAERNSAGLGFWHTFNDERYRTPPPPPLPRESSSGMSDENGDTPGSLTTMNADNPSLRHLQRPRSRASTPLGNQAPPTAGEVARKMNNKRRRDDDFDPHSFKRRAVSPGMSVQSSPILSQSPGLNNDKSWGHPPPKTNGHGDRSNSGSSTGNGVKRIGLLGMIETNDGIMQMSIE